MRITTSVLEDFDKFNQELDAAERELSISLSSSVNRTPDLVAEKNKLQQETGIIVSEDTKKIEELRKTARLKRIQAQNLPITSPLTAKMLRDPNFAAISHDDVENLSGIEQAFGFVKNLGKTAVSGYYGFRESAAGLDQFAGEILGGDLFNKAIGEQPMSTWAAKQRAEFAKKREEWMPQGDNWFTRGLYGGVSSFVQTLPSVLLAAAPGGQAPAGATILTRLFGKEALKSAGLMGLMTGGSAYGEARSQGLDKAMSTGYGTLHGGLEFVTEVAPMKALGKLFNRVDGAEVVKLVKDFVMKEFAGEQIATVTQDLADWMFLPENSEKTFKDYLVERPGAAAETAIATMVGAMLQGGLASGYSSAVNGFRKKEQKAHKTEALVQAMAKVADMANTSKLKARDPETFNQWLDDVTDGSPIENIYIGPDVYNQPELAQQLAEASPVIAEQLAEIQSTGVQKEIKVPMKVYLGNIASTALDGQIFNDIRLEGDDRTVREVKDFLQNREQELQKTYSEWIPKEKDAAFEKSAKEVEEIIYSQLKSATPFRSQVDRTYAALLRNLVLTEAKNQNMLPMDFYNKYRYKVRSQRMGAVLDGLVGAPVQIDGGNAIIEGFPQARIENSVKQEDGTIAHTIYAPIRNKNGNVVFRISATQEANGETTITSIERQDPIQFNQDPIPQTSIDTVRAQYENTDQWMLAPNGQPTYLTEDQWLKVRTPEFKNWFGDWETDPESSSKVVDENGEPMVVYHGTGRADRVGSYFNPDRATSGPMAFFTSDKKVAENYSKGKQDTSLSRDNLEDYKNQFTVLINQKETPITMLWRTFTLEQQKNIKKLAKQITFDEDGEGIVLQEGNTEGLGGFDYFLKNANGNVVEALIESWLYGGNLYREEHKFLEVLKLAGIENVKYHDPDYRDEAVYEVFIRIANPLDTTDIPKKIVTDLKRSANQADKNFNMQDGFSADLWDKTSHSPKEWIKKLTDDISEKTTYAWTSIPDFVTDTLKKHGYDGIKDSGGKYNPDNQHSVFIPFTPTQIKSVDNRGTFNPTEGNIYYQDGADTYNKEYDKIAKKFFGVTKNIKEAGYILNDGSLLDFSGKKFGADGGARNLDHKEVSDAFDEKDIEVGWEEFSNNGAIRFAPESNSFFITRMPSLKQISTMRKIIDSVDGEVAIDLAHTAERWGLDGSFSKFHEKGSLSDKILADIKTFFSGGKISPFKTYYQTSAERKPDQDPIPQSSIDTVRAQYENTDQWMLAPNGQPTYLTEDQWLKVRTPEFKNWFGDWETDPESSSKVVDENGEPLVVYHGTGAATLIEYDSTKKPDSHMTYSVNGMIYSTDSIHAAESYVPNKYNASTLYLYNQSSEELKNEIDKIEIPNSLKIFREISGLVSDATWFETDLLGNLTGMAIKGSNVILPKELGNKNYLDKGKGELADYSEVIQKELKRRTKLKNKIQDKENSKYSAIYSQKDGRFSIYNNVQEIDLPFDNLERNIKTSLYRSSVKIDDGSVLPFFENIRNPFFVDAMGSYSVGEIKHENITFGKVTGYSEDRIAAIHKIEEYSKTHGYDGAIVKNVIDFGKYIHPKNSGRLQTTFIAFNPTQIKSVDNRGTFDPNEGNIYWQDEDKGPRGTFDASTLTTTLNETADLSTFLHETGHFFLAVYEDLASQPNADSKYTESMQTILDWFGIKDLATWQAMTTEEKRPYHEQFAANYEIYLFEGKAPSLQLQSVFDRFTAFLRSVYKDYIVPTLNASYRKQFGKDLPMMTGEIRQVFDRMLASEEQIAEAEHVRNLSPMFLTQEESGMDDSEWLAYQAMVQEQREETISELTRKSLKSMKWLSNAKSKALKRLQSAAKVQRKEINKEVREEIEANPIFRAQQFLGKGLLYNEGAQKAKSWEKVNYTHKMSREIVSEIYGNYAEAMAPYVTGKEDGLHPDVVAEMFGLESGDQMIRELAVTLPMEEAIQDETDRRMLEEYGEMEDPAAIERAVDEALHAEARTRFVAMEYRFIAKANTPVRMMNLAAKRAAIGILSKRNIKSIRPHEFVLAEARAARQSIEAQKKGDSTAAIRYKEQQLLNHHLAKQAMEIRSNIESALIRFRKFFKTDKKLSKNRDTNLVNAGRSLLSLYGIGGMVDNPMFYVEKIKEYDPERYNDIAPILNDAINARANGKDFKALTVEEFSTLQEVLDSLWFLSRRNNEIVVAGRKISLQEAIESLMIPLEKIGIPPVIPGEKEAVGKKGDRRITAYSVKALGRRIEHWAYKLDNGEVGPFTKLIWRPVRTQINKYRVARTKYVKKYVDLLSTLELKREKINAPEIGYTFGAESGGLAKAELLGAMLHMGNQSNLTKLLVGRNWGSLNSDGTLNSERWDAFIKRMAEEGKITKADMDFVHAVWRLNDEIKPLAQRAHYEMNGYYFKEVEYTTIETPWGEYEGGYVPAKSDYRITRDEWKHINMEQIESDFRYSMPSTGDRFTKGRVEWYRVPLAIDIRLVAKHIDDVLRFSYVQPAVKDVLKILRNNEFSDSINRMDPGIIENMLIPWLTRSARQITTQPGMFPKADAFWRVVRQRAGISFLFANLRNALQQVVGFAPAKLHLKKAKLGTALMEFTKSPKELAEWVSSMSEYMDERLKNQIFDLTEQMNELILNPNIYKKVQKWSSKEGYFLQMAFQNVVDIVTWKAAYEQAMAELSHTMTDKEASDEAVLRADAAVSLTQGENTPESVAKFESWTPFLKTFSQFSGYFNMMGNLIISEAAIAKLEPSIQGKVRAFARVYALGFFIPSVLAEAIVVMLGGGLDDDDEDGYLDEIMEFFFSSQIRFAVASIPYGNMAAPILNSFNDKPYDDRIATSPSISVLESATVGTFRAVKNIINEDKEFTGKNIRDISTLLNLGTGIPVAPLGKTAGYWWDVNRGEIEPTSTYDAIRGTITGKASPASKQ